MFSFQVDLGQILIVGSIGIIGWFVKKTINDLENKLSDHDDLLHDLGRDVNRLIGAARARHWISDDSGQ